MKRDYGEPFEPQAWYRVIANIPRFVYEHLIRQPLKMRAYEKIPAEQRRKIEQEREAKGLEAALIHNFLK